MSLENMLSGRSQSQKTTYWYMKIPRVGNIIETKSKLMVTQSWELLGGGG